MLRGRDVVACMAVLFLTHMAWNETFLDNLSATLHLSFYLARQFDANAAVAAAVGSDGKKLVSGNQTKHGRLSMAPAVLDVDGDGSTEALVVIVETGTQEWKIQVLDLKPAAIHSDKTHLAPFRPAVMLESEKIDYMEPLHPRVVAADIWPLFMVTGQVMVKQQQDGDGDWRKEKVKDLESLTGGMEVNDRNRHFFCGTDWHDASTKCSKPCVGGRVEDCPQGERCYADTSCDIYDLVQGGKSKDQPAEMSTLHTTPAGGLPSIFTLWSNGVVTMHSLTADTQTPEEGSSASSRRKKSGSIPKLQVRPMWRVKIFPNKTKTASWEDVHLKFLDAVDAGNGVGTVLISGIMDYFASTAQRPDADEPDVESSSFVLALQAKTGEVLWESLTEEEEDEETAGQLLPLPVTGQGTTSAARRRSRVVSLFHNGHREKPVSEGGTLLPNCMQIFKRSVLTTDVLPFMYWEQDDASVQAVHFDPQHGATTAAAKTTFASKMSSPRDTKRKTTTKSKVVSSADTTAGSEPSSTTNAGLTNKAKQVAGRWLLPRKRSTKQRKLELSQQPRRGRPNVIVSRNQEGLQVRSLKNGRSLCHLALWTQTLYGDINHDGVLDSVNVITGHHRVTDANENANDDGYRFIADLARRVAKSSNLLETASKKDETKSGEEDKIIRTPLCHVQALSGVPSKEELFSFSLLGRHGLADPSMVDGTLGSPPLAVEAMHGKGHDIVVALNTGMVSRIRGKTGRRQWQIFGKKYHGKDFPTWSDDRHISLTRIDSENHVTPAQRPILLAGEQSMALISPRSGTILATAAFPQPSVTRPILADFNGDGTTDVLVVTRDAVWGYQVVVRTGASIFFRIVVGLLILGMMLALLRNQYGPKPGKRSTDA